MAAWLREAVSPRGHGSEGGSLLMPRNEPSLNLEWMYLGRVCVNFISLIRQEIRIVLCYTAI